MTINMKNPVYLHLLHNSFRFLGQNIQIQFIRTLTILTNSFNLNYQINENTSLT